MTGERGTGTQLHPDFYYGLTFLIIGAVLLWHTRSDRYDFDLLFGDVSTVFFPRIILILWIGLSSILIARGLLGRGSEEDRSRVASVGLSRLLLVLAAVFASAILLWLAGILVGGAISMIAVGLALGYRRWLVLVLASAALPLIIHYALGHVARISLPQGVLWG